MSDYGIQPTGFVIKPMEQSLADMQAAQAQGISQSLNFQADAILGVLNGIVAQAVSDAWEGQAALYSGMDPDTATADQLVGISLLSGTKQLAATPSICEDCIVNVGAGFDVAAGTMFASVAGSGGLIIFTNSAEVSNPTGSAANVDANFQCIDIGPTPCYATTLNAIATPLSGWNSITNPTDAILGTNVETDADLRLRREEELTGQGASTPAAIKAAVLKQLVAPTTTTDTLTCEVLYNNTDVIDANGLPPHSIEVIAYQPGNTSGDDLALATLILNEITGGTATHGQESVLVVDAQGNSRTVYFTRPSLLTLYVAATYKIVPTGNIGSFEANIADALAAFAVAEYSSGSAVYIKQLAGSALPTPLDPAVGVAGVLDWETFACDTNPTPVGTVNIPVSVRQVASFDTSRMAITAVYT